MKFIAYRCLLSGFLLASFGVFGQAQDQPRQPQLGFK